jgi:hypothetical protein
MRLTEHTKRERLTTLSLPLKKAAFPFIRRSFPVHFPFKCCSKGPFMAVFIGDEGASNIRKKQFTSYRQ